MKKLVLFLSAVLITIPAVSFAHSGRTDSVGCHTCRTNCSSWGLSTGEYHCHRSKGVAQPIEPVTSTRGDNGTGYTSPAPEYKAPKVTTTANTAPKINTTTVEKKSWFSRFIGWFK